MGRPPVVLIWLMVRTLLPMSGSVWLLAKPSIVSPPSDQFDRQDTSHPSTVAQRGRLRCQHSSIRSRTVGVLAVVDSIELTFVVSRAL